MGSPDVVGEMSCRFTSRTLRDVENYSHISADARDEKIAALEARLEQLEASVTRLEKWQRRLKEGTEFLNVNFLRAGGIDLHSEGKRRGWFVATEDGVEFCLYDGNEQMRVNISVDSSVENGTSVQLFGDQKRPETEEMAQAAKRGAVHMRQHEEVVRIGLGPDGGFLALFDNQANPCVVARGDSSGGSVATTNKAGQVLAVLRSSGEGGCVDLMPDTWNTLKSENEMPVMGVQLAARTQGGSCLLRGDQARGTFVTLAVNEDTGLLILGDEICSNRASIAVSPQVSQLTVHHSEDAPEISLTSAPTLASVALKGSDGKSRGEWVAISKPDSVLESQCAFYLLDSQGRRRVGAVASESVATLQLCDETERDRMVLLASDDGSALFIRDANGTERVTIQADPSFLLRDQEGRVAGFFDTNSGGRLTLLAAPSPDENLELIAEADVLADELSGKTASGTDEVLKRGTSFLNGPATRQRVVVAAQPDAAGMAIYGVRGEEQLLLSVGEVTSHIQIKDAEGTPHLDLATGEDGGRVMVLNDAGAPRVYIGIKENLGSLALLRSDGSLDALLDANEDGGQLQLFDEYGERSATLPEPGL